jgi:L(+)-tartrate dehydratase alpha subunit
MTTGATIDVYMAGGGCTLPGAAKVLMPGQGYEGVTDFVLDVITSRGVNACPPLLVGVGVSTSVETAARLSKLAFMRRWIRSKRQPPNAALMEEAAGRGPQRDRHRPPGPDRQQQRDGREHRILRPSPLDHRRGRVNTGCWAHRRGKIRINADLSYEILSHEGVVL